MAHGAAVHFRLDEICGVAVDVEVHVASVEPYDGVWLRGCVFHEHFRLNDACLAPISLNTTSIVGSTVREM